MGSCQNYGPVLGTLNNRCRIIIGTQKGEPLRLNPGALGPAAEACRAGGFPTDG